MKKVLKPRGVLEPRRPACGRQVSMALLISDARREEIRKPSSRLVRVPEGEGATRGALTYAISVNIFDAQKGF
ncbi:MAG TPA: hypothetical protein VJK26_00215 [Patescibacteria group bacterium]|nr:hypothetical protein [Patescibacteria group bacterium]